MHSIFFHLQIKPFPKERPRFNRSGRVYTPIRTVNYEVELQYLAKSFIPEKPHPGAFHLHLYFYLPKPKKTKFDLYPMGKPDTDNLVKAVMDAFNGLFWVDDSQMIEIHAGKFWATTEPGINVKIDYKGE